MLHLSVSPTGILGNYVYLPFPQTQLQCIEKYQLIITFCKITLNQDYYQQKHKKQLSV